MHRWTWSSLVQEVACRVLDADVDMKNVVIILAMAIYNRPWPWSRMPAANRHETNRKWNTWMILQSTDSAGCNYMSLILITVSHLHVLIWSLYPYSLTVPWVGNVDVSAVNNQIIHIILYLDRNPQRITNSMIKSRFQIHGARPSTHCDHNGHNPPLNSSWGKLQKGRTHFFNEVKPGWWIIYRMRYASAPGKVEQVSD